LYFACVSSFFHYDEPPPTVIYTLSLHDALPISIYNAYTKTIVDPTMRSLNERIANLLGVNRPHSVADFYEEGDVRYALRASAYRSEEHTSELQSQSNLVCRLLLEKKKKQHIEAR